MSSSARRRDKLFVIAEMLKLASEGILKTQMMYRANLSYTQINDYVIFLLRIGLAKLVLKDGKDVFVTTEKGLDFLQHYEEIMSLLHVGSDTLVCTHCQKEAAADHKFCPYCGKALEIQIEVRTK